MISSADQSESTKSEEFVVQRRTKVSSISLNIPAAGLGSRPPSVVSTSTSDEGGFNEPSPKIEAKLKPHEESIYDYVISEDKPLEYTDISPEDESDEYKEIMSSPTKLTQSEIEALYAVPHKPNSVQQQRSVTSTDSEVSQVTVIAQKSIDSDVMYNSPSNVVSNVVLSELESQESFDRRELPPIPQSANNTNYINSSSTIVNKSDLVDSCNRKSDPFILKREVLQMTEKTSSAVRTPETQKSEANILDLNDVEYADASDNEEDNVVIMCDKSSDHEAESMTPDEAENLLSTK